MKTSAGTPSLQLEFVFSSFEMEVMCVTEDLPYKACHFGLIFLSYKICISSSKMIFIETKQSLVYFEGVLFH
jgi:hypothetical protein